MTDGVHETINFQGLLERVRERGGTRGEVGGSGGSRRVHNQVLRLFSHDESDVQPALIESPTKSGECFFYFNAICSSCTFILGKGLRSFYSFLP